MSLFYVLDLLFDEKRITADFEKEEAKKKAYDTFVASTEKAIEQFLKGNLPKMGRLTVDVGVREYQLQFGSLIESSWKKKHIKRMVFKVRDHQLLRRNAAREILRSHMSGMFYEFLSKQLALSFDLQIVDPLDATPNPDDYCCRRYAPEEPSKIQLISGKHSIERLLKGITLPRRILKAA